ncbi:MAG TPA: zinc ribbon domain-containing protein [Gammaproteobacteria bacterium]|nr:zinc ribbon domain-containing protein [Gammaproteobacteria bacterium]
MPIYEYRCRKCGHEFEKLQKISDEPLKTCPECGADALEKLVSAAGFRLKGGGWYETDFKSKNRKNVAKADKKPDSGSGKKAGAGEKKG